MSSSTPAASSQAPSEGATVPSPEPVPFLSGVRPAEPVTAYVLKMYPRFSETFILGEMLAREAAGERLEVISLRQPVDGRFHAALAQLRAPVTYLPTTSSASEAWRQLRAARSMRQAITAHLDELLQADAGDAVQAVRLAELVRARGIGHLHAHFASVATTVARLASLLSGVPFSFTAHAKDIYHESVDPEDLRRKLADAHHVVTVSDYNLAHLRDTYGSDADRVHRVYNGLDLTEAEFSDPADRAPLVAAVGRLVPKKGFDVLLDALALVHRRHPEVRAVIAGGGELSEQLRAQRDRLGLAAVVDLPGPVPQTQVRELLHCAAVFAAPCVVGADGNRDGLPTVLLEAMAAGTPAVSTDVTGIPEVVRDDETGLLVPQHDAVRLAEAIERLLTDRQLASRLSLAARGLVERSFDVQVQAETLRRLDRMPVLPRPTEVVR
jgi:glycosyltransferase involved in cell wall biosynthesis